jgi:protein-S-isoprenylcysteine O-methyltransferase Ste14
MTTRTGNIVGFILVMLGFLVQWPTLLTLAMFPVLVVMYVRLGKQEERDARAAFGETYDEHAARVPGFVPHWSRITGRPTSPKTA